MDDTPKPSLDPVSFSDVLVNILQKYRELNSIPEDTLASLILRYDNPWINGIFEDYEDGSPGLTNKLREHVKCAIIDSNSVATVSSQIESRADIPERVRESLDYSQRATVVQIGNVNVSFILSPINPDGSIIR